ncbi:hypothetical protein [Haloferula sp. BvORR071]|uniref:hypothetical protein n=1 Tax=Haloferula sp. BvORR071 TaxID=1396141 RepID=UPI00054D318A|nr:hypothetical protein [Haloferula sp. BvORR071]
MGDPTVELSWRSLGETDEIFQFVVEAKSRSTPEAIERAIAKASATGGAPLILVPYLSDKRLDELEQRRVSGIDACGNGLIISPGKLLVSRRGNPNLYPDSRSLNKPFNGRSAMVGRMLLAQGRWPSLNALHQALATNGAVDEIGKPLSLSQVSKAVSALVEERIVRKAGGSIILTEPLLLLEELAKAWKMPGDPVTYFANVEDGLNIADCLSSLSLSTPVAGYQRLLRWGVTGESSVSLHSALPRHGPLKIAVSNILMALNAMGRRITKAVTPGFADVQFIETKESGFYFGNIVGTDGLRWASLLQTWLELQAGDARQQESARDLKKRLIEEITNESGVPRYPEA